MSKDEVTVDPEFGITVTSSAFDVSQREPIYRAWYDGGCSGIEVLLKRDVRPGYEPEEVYFYNFSQAKAWLINRLLVRMNDLRMSLKGIRSLRKKDLIP